MRYMKKGTTGEVHVHVDASPDVVYKVVSDVTRMGEWSPETTKCEWLDGATGAEVGARFKGTNKKGFATWSTKPTVVAADPGREFAFAIGNEIKWTYRFEPDAGGMKLSESFEVLRDLPWYFSFAHRWFMGTKDRRADLEQGMAKTLDRIKHVVETG
jgi:glucose/arabinose dehydrogenase